MFFPITNDPLPGSAKVAAAPSAPSGGSTRWIVISFAGVLCALALAFVAFTVAKRRKNASGELRVTPLS
jgi:hypothetical protein